MIEIDLTMPRLFTEGPGELTIRTSLESGSLTVLTGPSGAGKTTLLRLVAGLETPSSGRIVVDGHVWFDTQQRVDLPPQKRSIGYVFQDTALFPNMTVQEAIQFAAPKGDPAFVKELIDRTGLGTFMHQKPAQLSGGQRQRVALARALVRRPQVLLLDEPFAALDTQASESLRQVLSALHQVWQATTLLVSHHAQDAQIMANRVIRIVQGKVQLDERAMDKAVSAQVMEPILHIAYHEEHQQWIIQTVTTQLQSTNPAWGQQRVGDLILVRTAN
ncbi:sulfate/molybdate ABC transporter ATP-binding protein [Spirosoma panaciterrae]|uniref:sulfate/molybdate ABC transporter ATP-binding protein n=1 Tax=Spirosoma panaciterrae TaxID=496058 RepID=UPI000371F9CF|nr:ATP-binding cassette domain-containing protein [Spirosoma panaciterrae]